MTSPRRGLESGTHGTSYDLGEDGWTALAACIEVDPELFFTENPIDIRQAKSICRGCEVQTECLREALDRREPTGVWGGELFVAGRVVKPKRRVITQDAA